MEIYLKKFLEHSSIEILMIRDLKLNFHIRSQKFSYAGGKQ